MAAAMLCKLSGEDRGLLEINRLLRTKKLS